MYRSLTRYSAITGLGIFTLDMLAHKFYWYTSIFGFDKAMHTLGGIFTVFVISALCLKQLVPMRAREIFITLVLGAFVVGLIWEYYEYAIQMYVKFVHLADIPDSIGDLIFDTIGGSISACFVIFMRKRYNERQQ